MKRSGILRQFLLVFLVVLAGYIGFYQWDKHLRVRKGPWRVTFTALEGAPALVIDQPALGIHGVTVRFNGETVPENFAPVVVRFDHPSKRVPVGKLVFDDLMYLPGTVTLQLHGHEIELLPRTLVINRKEIPWRSQQTFVLAAADKLPVEALEPRRKR